MLCIAENTPYTFAMTKDPLPWETPMSLYPNEAILRVPCDDDEQRLRTTLILQATARLRRRKLEERLMSMISQTSHVLEDLTQLHSSMTSPVSTNDTTMDALDDIEYQLDQYSTILSDADAQSRPATMSRSALSAMSSWFRRCRRSSVSTHSSSITASMSDWDLSDTHTVTTESSAALDPVARYAEEQRRRTRRRRRVRQCVQQRRKHPQDDEDVVSGMALSDGWPAFLAKTSRPMIAKETDAALMPLTMETDPDHPSCHILESWHHGQEDLASASSLSRSLSSSSSSVMTRLSDASDSFVMRPDASLDRDAPHDPTPWGDDDDQPHYSQYHPYNDYTFHQDPAHALIPSHPLDEVWTRPHPGAPWNKAPASTRNVLDDTLDFLDGYGDDDAEFCEDMYFLLQHPDLCCRPLSEIRETMAEIRQSESDASVVSVDHGRIPELAGSVVGTSWKWCKFVSVLCAAVMISLIHGPDDLTCQDDDETDPCLTRS